MAGRLHISLYLDPERDVLAIAFTQVTQGDGERPAAGPGLPIRAVRMEQLAPGMVAKYDTQGHLVGIDLLGASKVLGLPGVEGMAFSVSAGSPAAGASAGSGVTAGSASVVPAAGGAPALEGATATGVAPAAGDAQGAGAMPGAGVAPAADSPPDAEVTPLPKPPIPLQRRRAGRRAQAVGAPAPGWWVRLLAPLRARFMGRKLCPNCGGDYAAKDLAFKRFLRREEAERLSPKVRLKSHFVYACPHCRGDLLDQ